MIDDPASDDRSRPSRETSAVDNAVVRRKNPRIWNPYEHVVVAVSTVSSPAISRLSSSFSASCPSPSVFSANPHQQPMPALLPLRGMSTPPTGTYIPSVRAISIERPLIEASPPTSSITSSVTSPPLDDVTADRPFR